MDASVSGPLKDRFTSLDTLAIVRELRGLGRVHIDKAFDGAGEAVSLTLRATGIGRRELLLVPGRYAAIGPIGDDHGDEPGPLARELRRLLSGAVLAEVAEPGGERYLELTFQRGDTPEPLRLAVELFGGGNVLVARGSKIVAVAHAKTWAHRAVRVGAEYLRPPSRGDPWSRTASEIEAALLASRTDRASTLAARLSFGGPLSEELLARSELPGDAPAAVDAAVTAHRLHEAIAGLLAELGDRPAGYLYGRGGEYVDVEPFRSRRWSESEETTVEVTATFSEAAHRFFSSRAPVVVAAETLAWRAARAELDRQIAQQELAIAGLEAEAADLTVRAEAIYAHYAEAESIRVAAEAADGSEATVEAELGGLRVTLRVREPLERSARGLYEEAKRAQAKLVGAREALVDTRRRVDAAPEPATSAPGSTSSRARAERKPLWFEQFRWFLSSDGVLVIGGKDAVSNDRIVKRYLKAADRYVHADIHGAASVIVKHPSEPEGPIPETTLVEAAQWAVTYSKAWRGGLASGTAFWVHAEQVSKSAASGEFVPRGAWAIHGTKNFLRDLPTEVGLGTVEIQGAERWSAAPPSALRSRGRLRVVLVPGEDRDRARLEVDLAGELGISRSLLQSLLPAGGASIRRT